MKKQLLALAASLALVSTNAFAASVVVSSDGTPVSSTGNGVVTSGTGATEITPVKVAAPKPMKDVKHSVKAAPAKAKAPAKKVVKKKTVTKKETVTKTHITDPSTNTTTTITSTPTITEPVAAPTAH